MEKSSRVLKKCDTSVKITVPDDGVDTKSCGVINKVSVDRIVPKLLDNPNSNNDGNLYTQSTIKDSSSVKQQQQHDIVSPSQNHMDSKNVSSLGKLDIIMEGKACNPTKPSSKEKIKKLNGKKKIMISAIDESGNLDRKTIFKMQSKPVILTAANTNKPIKLEPRKKSETIEKKKSVTNKNKMIEKKSKNDVKQSTSSEQNTNVNLKVAPSTLQLTPSTLNIGKSLEARLKSFAKMDVEFYDIINKMDKENDNEIIPPNNEVEIVTNICDLDRKSEIIEETIEECIINVVDFDSNNMTIGQKDFVLSDELAQNDNSKLDSMFVQQENLISNETSTLTMTKPDQFLSNQRKNSTILGKSTTPSTLSKSTHIALADKNISKMVVDFNNNLGPNDIHNNPRDSLIVNGSRLQSRFGKSEGEYIENSTCEDNEERETISTLLQKIPSDKLSEMEEALRTLNIDIQVSNEDILNVTGGKVVLEEKQLLKLFEKNRLRRPQTIPAMNTVHQFCTSYKAEELDLNSKTISRFSHAPSQYVVLKPKIMNNIEESRFDVSEMNEEADDIPTSILQRLDNLADENVKISNDIVDNDFSVMAERVMKNLDDDDKKICDAAIESRVKYPEKEEVDNLVSGIVGEKIDAKNDKSRYFNTLYPPKFNITPQNMISKLTPKYVSVLENENEITEEYIEEDDNTDISSTTVHEFMSSEEQVYKERIINRKHNSVMEMDKLVLSSNESDEETSESEVSERFMSVLDLRRKFIKERPSSAFSISSNECDIKPAYKRSISQPNMKFQKESKNLFSNDYNSIMHETIIQCEQIEFLSKHPPCLEDHIVDQKIKIDEEYLIKRKEEILTTNVQTLTRSMSLTNVTLARKSELSRTSSDTALHLLGDEVMTKYDTFDGDLNDWLKEEFWYKWFDELYEPNNVMDEIFSFGKSESVKSLTNEPFDQIDTLPKVDSVMFDIACKEIDSISERIEKISPKSGLLGFHFCRRGACYRKIGELRKALDDLNRAIELEPKLSDAYWHRHLVYIVQNNTKKALEDLSRITLYNPNHTAAHRSKAEIYRGKGDSHLAISGFNQAISSDPKNAELYYARAELLEKRGEYLLAIDDYRSADLYDPENTLALKKIGFYHFENQLWMISVNDFTALIKKQPSKQATAEAHLYRGRAWAKLGKFAEAISDLSISITLEPNNYLSLYYRGSFLRKCMPKKALQDLSVSLLLNSTVDNVKSYFHRGIIYTEMKRFDQALCDFQQAVLLDPHLAAAHCNLGIIEMKHNRNIHLSVKRFNTALKMDPTYIRAILCRAEAAEKVNNINGAILDYTRAIHMKPESIDLRMTRGRLLLKKNHLESASFHIKQCAAMDDGKNSSPTQKAAVQSFLKNYTYAIRVLETAVRTTPIVNLFTLLGRTKMKAKLYKDAIVNLNHALKMYEPWDVRQSWPKESGEVFFLIGVCHMELKEYKSALESFNVSLKTNPTFAEGYFKRGLVRMKLGVSKGVSDFNKALSYRPEYYQAYLGRAAYYGMNKRHAKAIMNCNEAIKIEKESIRAYLYRGALKYNIKSYSLAIKDLSQAIRMDSSCALAYFNRAVCFHEKKYHFHAIKDYSIVLMLNSNLHMKALLNRGLLYYQIGDVDTAIHDFVAAMEEDPDNPKLHHTLGLCYHKLGNLQKSIESYTSAIKVDPFFSTAYLGRGNVLLDYNQKLGTLLGRRDYLRALHMNPLCMEARVNLAYSLQIEGRFKKAWNLFTRAIEIKPSYKAALEGRALVNLQMSNTFGAFVDMNSALSISKTAESLTLRGVVNQFLNDQVSAMNDYRSAKNLDPTYSLAYYNAANQYFLHRQLSQAISFYSKAVDWNPNDGGAILNRAVAKTIHKDYDGAFEDFATVEKLYPHWSHIYFNRGYLYYLTEKYEDAEEDYTRALILQSEDALLFKKRADARGKSGKKELALIDHRRSVHLQMLQKS